MPRSSPGRTDDVGLSRPVPGSGTMRLVEYRIGPRGVTALLDAGVRPASWPQASGFLASRQIGKFLALCPTVVPCLLHRQRVQTLRGRRRQSPDALSPVADGPPADRVPPGNLGVRRAIGRHRAVRQTSAGCGPHAVRSSVSPRNAGRACAFAFRRRFHAALGRARRFDLLPASLLSFAQQHCICEALQ
jgi:hypothetical protein